MFFLSLDFFQNLISIFILSLPLNKKSNKNKHTHTHTNYYYLDGDRILRITG